jgi:hypothetical protein
MIFLRLCLDLLPPFALGTLKLLPASTSLSSTLSLMAFVYLYGISCRIFFDSTAETVVAWRKCRFRFLFFDERMCRLNPLLRLIFPLPVTRNLFAADRLVLSFGTGYSSV